MLWYFIYLGFRGNHSRPISRPLVRRIRLLWPYVTIRSFPIRGASFGPCAAHVDCHSCVSSLVYFQWLQRKKRKRRREFVKKRQKKVRHWWTCFSWMTWIYERLRADSVMMMSAGSEGWKSQFEKVCASHVLTPMDVCADPKHTTHTYGNI